MDDIKYHPMVKTKISKKETKYDNKISYYARWGFRGGNNTCGLGLQFIRVFEVFGDKGNGKFKGLIKTI
ncbi:MAG: hypothetical protein ACK4TF_00205 [Thermodesulfovibrionales bacterium]